MCVVWLPCEAYFDWEYIDEGSLPAYRRASIVATTFFVAQWACAFGCTLWVLLGVRELPATERPYRQQALLFAASFMLATVQNLKAAMLAQH